MENIVNMNLLEVISTSVIMLYAFPFILYIETANIKWLWFFIGMMVSGIASLVVKALALPLGGLFLRPVGAGSCGLFCSTNNVSNALPRAGFPSGHMTAVAFFFTMYYLLIHPARRTWNVNIGIAAVASVYIACMAVARYYTRCHNILQIIVGVVFGSGFGLVWYKLICRGQV